MSRIDELIRQYAPDGVTYKALGDVARLRRGTSITQKGLRPGNVPVIAGGRSPAYFHAEHNRDGETIVVAGSGAYAGYVTWWSGPIFVSDAFSIQTDASVLLPRFCYYWLESQQRRLHSEKRGSGVPHVYARDVADYKVPVPPTEVQSEIVGILDSFTKLEAELEAELAARQQQYAHYRDTLLTFPLDEATRWLPLGDVTTIVRGASPRPIQRFLTDSDDGVPWIKIGDVAATGKYITTTAQRVTSEGAARSRRISPGDFVLSNSMSFGRPYISRIEGCIHDGWLAIRGFRDDFVPDFLYHLLRSSPIQSEFRHRAGSGGAVSNLNSEIVRSVVVPIPNLDEQRQVIGVLDNFDALVNDRSSGLLAELEARRQQYNYYRDRLLSFEEEAT